MLTNEDADHINGLFALFKQHEKENGVKIGKFMLLILEDILDRIQGEVIENFENSILDQIERVISKIMKIHEISVMLSY